MNITKTFSLVTLITVYATLAACTAAPTPPADAQVVKITENALVTGQITQTKTFDQCDSSSTLKTEVEFSDSNTQTNQEELVVGLEVAGGGKVSGAVELEIKGSIQKHFSETAQQQQSQGGKVSIEVPPHTKQEYTIIWNESRREGVVEYEENGQTYTTNYSYRIGIELVNASGKDLPCGEATAFTASPQENSQQALTIRKPDPAQVAAGLPSIWDANNITVKDMLSPGEKSYSGSAVKEVEYLFPVYWCATTETILIDNRKNITTEFFVNGTQIPESLISVSGYNDSAGWRCINTSTLLGGWVTGETYTLLARREFKTSIYDGKNKYPAGTYIYELKVSVR